MKQKTLDTFLLESTDPRHFARITILYSPLRAMKSRKYSGGAFIRLGGMVVSIANCPQQENVLNMSRDMLIAIAASHRFLNTVRPARSRGILHIMESHRMKNIIKVLNRLPTSELVDECLILMAAVRVLLPPYRFKLLYSPDVMDMAKQMTFSVLYAIDSFRSYARHLSELTPKDDIRPVRN